MATNFSSGRNRTLNEPSVLDLLLNVPGLDFVLLSWITGTTLFVMEALIVLGNGFVIIAIAFDPLKTIRRCPSNHLVLSLAVADFLVGALVCFFGGLWYINVAAFKRDLFGAAEMGSGIGNFNLVAISTTNLLALSVDRLIAIKAPLHYSNKVTKRKVRIVIVCAWVYFVAIGFVLWNVLPTNSRFKTDFLLNCHATLAFLALGTVCVLVIYFLQKRTAAMKNRPDPSPLLRTVMEREKKVTRGVVFLTLVFIACFIPFFIYQLLELFCFSCFRTNESIVFLVIFRNVSLMLLFFNSLVNPYLYALRLQKYAETFKYLGRKFLCFKTRIFPEESMMFSQMNRSIVTAS